ncbi:stress response membrane protein YncL [Pluralibacter sp.]|nr:stress response membrane protein YncL [Pluralibacter sp.]MBV8042362.1 stress response membrane protein YncL [Pluralibacter sp.]
MDVSSRTVVLINLLLAIALLWLLSMRFGWF